MLWGLPPTLNVQRRVRRSPAIQWKTHDFDRLASDLPRSLA